MKVGSQVAAEMNSKEIEIDLQLVELVRRPWCYSLRVEELDDSERLGIESDSDQMSITECRPYAFISLSSLTQLVRSPSLTS